MVYPSNSLFNLNRDIYQHVIIKDVFRRFSCHHQMQLPYIHRSCN
ncbi:hypothetical protein F383_37533 [Gossypium arboreum]|uniref:Uncharacterized protein n=1 Tax=Gossypium arboreum TaxID=29729 RepID=A0A0B0MHM1_GOSAR|nr:hypothetical protein F383_37533 [Gossypium arboreum]